MSNTAYLCKLLGGGGARPPPCPPIHSALHFVVLFNHRKALSVYKSWSMFIVLLFRHPHILKQCEGRYYRSTNPRWIFSLRRRYHFHSYSWQDAWQFFLHSLRKPCQYKSIFCHFNAHSIVDIRLIWAVTWDFQQCGILTCVVSDEPLQPPFKLRNSQWYSVSSSTLIYYSSD